MPPFIIYAVLAGFFVVHAPRRPSWRMQPHYKTLAARIAQPLLLTAEEAALRDKPLPIAHRATLIRHWLKRLAATHAARRGDYPGA